MLNRAMPTSGEIEALRAALTEIRASVVKAQLAGHVREVLSRVTTYERTLERWIAVPPSEFQYAALEELVRELHERVVFADRPTPQM